MHACQFYNTKGLSLSKVESSLHMISHEFSGPCPPDESPWDYSYLAEIYTVHKINLAKILLVPKCQHRCTEIHQYNMCVGATRYYVHVHMGVPMCVHVCIQISMVWRMHVYTWVLCTNYDPLSPRPHYT